jgi:hypothetical protein
VDRAGPSYSADSVRLIGEAEQATGRPELVLIMSAETFAGLPDWHEPGGCSPHAGWRWCREAATPPDPAWIETHFPGQGDRIVVLDGPRLEVSSTAIRERSRPAVPSVTWCRRRSSATSPIMASTSPHQPGGSSASDRPRPRPAPAACPSSGTCARHRAIVARIARRIVELAEDKKAADIVLLKIAPLTTVADYLVICSGGSERQLDAIADGITEGLRAETGRSAEGSGMLGSRGLRIGRGARLPPPERDFYQLGSTGRRRRRCASSAGGTLTGQRTGGPIPSDRRAPPVAQMRA